MGLTAHKGSQYWALLQGNRNYRMLWMAQVVSEVGDWLYTLSLYSLLLKLTGSAQVVAIAVVLQLLPQVFVGPLAGVLNDRLSRKNVMIAADAARVLIIAGMLWAGRAGSVPAIYVLLVLETVMWAFFEPGRTAILPNIVRNQEETALATTLGAATWSANFSIGSALGGLIGVSLGYDTVFVINALSFLLSAVLISRITVDEPHAAAHPRLRLRDLVDFTPYTDGARYIAGDRRLLATLMVKAAFGALGLHWVVVPIFGERVFPVHRPGYTDAQAGLLGMSVLTTARGFGAMLGPLAAGGWVGGDAGKMRKLIGAGFLVMGAGYIALSAASNIHLAFGSLMVLGAGAATAWTFSTTMLQLQTEDRFRGRVFSTDFSFLLLNMSLATYVAGVLVDHHVPIQTIALGAGLASVIPAALWWRAQRLWRDD